MRKIVYYVATSLDGFIANLDQGIEGFVGGSGVEKYLSDLQGFDTVIMGRNTYEFGYRFGLQPGQPAYQNMKHYIFSRHLVFENPHPDVFVVKPNIDFIWQLKSQPGSEIYLCGGGDFAGWLLENEMIDTLKLKLNPLILSEGIRLFGSSKKKINLELQDSNAYDQGLHIMTYSISYPLRLKSLQQ